MLAQIPPPDKQVIRSSSKPDQKINDIGREVDSEKKWRKDMETVLKNIYVSIRDDPVFRVKDIPKKKEPLLKSNSAWALTNAIFSSDSSKSKVDKSPQAKKAEEVKIVEPEAKVLIQGVVIRKHVSEGEEKARNRRWAKYWASVTMDEKGLDLVLKKVSGASTEFTPAELDQLNEIPEEQLMYATTPDSIPSSPTPPQSNNSSPTNNYKLSSSEPEVLSLIHAYTLKDHKVPSRPHVFRIFTANNNLYLFETVSAQMLNNWIYVINYYSALKSKEPMRGSFGNIEYGWADLNLDEAATSPKSPKFDKVKQRKIAKWPLPPISTKIVSNKPIVLFNNKHEQFECIKTQLKLLVNDLKQHEILKPYISLYVRIPNQVAK